MMATYQKDIAAGLKRLLLTQMGSQGIKTNNGLKLTEESKNLCVYTSIINK